MKRRCAIAASKKWVNRMSAECKLDEKHYILMCDFKYIMMMELFYKCNLNIRMLSHFIHFRVLFFLHIWLFLLLRVTIRAWSRWSCQGQICNQ